MLDKLKMKAKELKREIFVLYLSYKDDRVPWYAKLFTLCVLTYAFSPIDLIPDFIPILGYLDDLIIVPLGIFLALKMIPIEVIQENRLKAEELLKNKKPKNWFMGALFILIWVIVAYWIGTIIYDLFVDLG